MSTAFGTSMWNTSSISSSPSSSRSSSASSSPSSSPNSDTGDKFNWMDAISQLQSQISEESKYKRKYAIYTIPEETKDDLVRYKSK